MNRLTPACVNSIATCMGGEYTIGDFRATCSHIRSITPVARVRNGPLLNFVLHCCKEGHLIALKKFYIDVPDDSWLSSIVKWAAQYNNNHIVAWALDGIYAKFAYRSDARMFGATKKMFQIFQDFRKCHNMADVEKFEDIYLEEYAGRTGSMEMCEQVRRLNNSRTLDHFLWGAAYKGHANLCEDLILKGATNIKEMVYSGALCDSVEVFDIGVRHIGFEAAVERCKKVLRPKLYSHIKDLRPDADVILPNVK